MPRFSSTDLQTPSGIERVLRQFQTEVDCVAAEKRAVDAQLARINSPAFAQSLAPYLQQTFQAGGNYALNITNLIGGNSPPALFEDTHANRPTLYPPGSYSIGTLFYETDRTVLYAIAINSSGVRVWQYVAGVAISTLAAIPADLTTSDSGLLAWTSDVSHLFRWTGSAWTWGPADCGSGFYQLFEIAPAGYGATAWQLVNGATVARTNSDATTTNVTLDDVTTAAYLKAGITSAAVAAASGTVAATTAVNHANDLNQEVMSGTGVFVAADPHTHVQDSHVHAPGTLELRNKQARLYYRR